jgi:hypothetical protein
MDANFFELKDKIITEINGLETGSDVVTIHTNDGTYTLFHRQDCCESVSVNRIDGNSDGVLNSVVVLAEEDNTSNPDWTGYSESYTWTTFHIVTANGNSLKIYWLGESNGWYSESVSVTKN